MSIINSGYSSLWQRKKVDVVASAIVDTLDVSTFRGIRYVFSVYNKTQDVTKMFDMSIVQESGGIKEVVFGKIGSSIKINVSTSIVSSQLNLVVVNNELYTISVEFIRMIFN